MPAPARERSSSLGGVLGERWGQFWAAHSGQGPGDARLNPGGPRPAASAPPPHRIQGAVSQGCVPWASCISAMEPAPAPGTSSAASHFFLHLISSRSIQAALGQVSKLSIPKGQCPQLAEWGVPSEQG